MINYQLPKFSNWAEVIAWQAAHQPEQIAQTFLLDGESNEINLSFAQLADKAHAIAAALQAPTPRGVRLPGGERALLLYVPGNDFVSAFLGCLCVGVLAVPVYPPRRGQMDQRLLGIMLDAQPAFILCSAKIRDDLYAHFADMIQVAGIRVIATDQLADGLATEWRDPHLPPHALAFIQYTSGSTGVPKGVLVSHANLLDNVQRIVRSFEHPAQACSLFWLPEYHDMGLIGGILAPLYRGARAVRMSPLDFLQKPARWLQAITNYRAATSGAPNFAYDLCVERITPDQRATLALHEWTLAFSGAEPVRAETLDRFVRTFAPHGFQRAAFYPCYGMAEATLMISAGQRLAGATTLGLDESALAEHVVQIGADESLSARKVVGCGAVGDDQLLLIVDPTTLTPCPPEWVGEIWLQSPSVAQGYWQQPELSAATFGARLRNDPSVGPFLRTGDLGFVRDGQLFITGRLKDVIIIRGRNHYPQDIEQTVDGCHPALRAGCGAAFAVELGNEERLVIAQEVDRHHLNRLNVDEVAAAIRRVVAEQHGLQPAAVVLLRTTTLPKTSSGKLQRFACRKAFLGQNLDVVGEWRAPNLQLTKELSHG